MAKHVLFLQDLGVDKNKVETLVHQSGLVPVWQSNYSEINNPEEFVAICTITTPIKSELLAYFPNVRVVSVAFTGYDCVDLEACRQRNIAVHNVPAYSTDSVAELVLGLTIGLLRNLNFADQSFRTGGAWALPFGPGRELSGKTVGIIGTGAIGLRVAEIFKVFKCKLIGWSRTQKDSFTNLGGVYKATIHDVFQEADIVSIHLPANEHTRGIINRECLSLLKPNACLINASRGVIVDQQALTTLVQEQRFFAGIDVFEQEPVPDDSPVRHLPISHSFLTPHVAYKTVEALERRAEIAVSNVQTSLAGQNINRVA